MPNRWAAPQCRCTAVPSRASTRPLGVFTAAERQDAGTRREQAGIQLGATQNPAPSRSARGPGSASQPCITCPYVIWRLPHYRFAGPFRPFRGHRSPAKGTEIATNALFLLARSRRDSPSPLETASAPQGRAATSLLWFIRRSCPGGERCTKLHRGPRTETDASRFAFAVSVSKFIGHLIQ